MALTLLPDTVPDDDPTTPGPITPGTPITRAIYVAGPAFHAAAAEVAAIARAERLDKWEVWGAVLDAFMNPTITFDEHIEKYKNARKLESA